MLLVRQGPAHFSPLTDLCVAGDIGIHIDRTFALDEVPAALRYVGDGHAHGKVVVAID
jgi:NADPH:quinone reductase-like Zn-dependent oxidoreductase